MSVIRICSFLILAFLASCVHTQKSAREPAGEAHPAAEPTQAEITSCYRAVCGRAKDNWTGARTYTRPGNDLTPFNKWQNEFVPRLRRLAEGNLANDRNYLRQIEMALANPLPKSLPVPTANIIKLRRMTQIFEPLVDTSMWPVVKLNEEKLKSAYEAIKSDNEREVAKRHLQSLFERLYLHHPQVATDGVNNPIALRLEREYPKEKIENALKIDGGFLLQKSEALRARLGAEASRNVLNEFSTELFKRAAAGDDFSMQEGELYVAAANVVEYLADFVLDDDFWKLLTDLPFDLEKEIEQVKSSNVLGRWQEWMDRHDVNSAVKEISDYCYPKLSVAVANSASGLRVNKAAQMIAEVRRAATTVARRYYSDLQQDYMGEVIKKIEFTNPETPEELYSRLRRAIAQLERKMKVNQTPPKDVALLLSSAISVGDNLKDFDKDLDGLEPLKSACEMLPITDLNDRAISLQAKVRLSWYAANYPEIGVSVVAHEMGHVTSRYLILGRMVANLVNSIAVKAAADSAPQEDDPYRQFSKSRECITARNPYGQTTPKGMDSNWSEEDWADHFSSQVMQEMARTGSTWASPVNLGCAFPDILSEEYAEETMAPKDKDPHSSNALRLILIGADRGALPQACQPVIRKMWMQGAVPQCN